MTRPRIVLTGLWWLTLIGLAVRVWRASTIAGSYDGEIDSLLVLAQRGLRGTLLYQDSYLRQWPIAQWLYIPSAWLGSIRVHRLLVLGLDLLAGLLMARAVRNCSAAGLIPLKPRSLVPLASGVLLVVLAQKLPGGLAGSLHQFANFFLALGLNQLSLAAAGEGSLSSRSRWRQLVATGSCALLAVACFFTLIYPLTLVAALVLVHHRHPAVIARALITGVALGCALMIVPYLVVADGLALFFAGAVALPLEWASQQAWWGENVGNLFSELARMPLAGLPIWSLALMPSAGLLLIARRAWRSEPRPQERLLLVPGLAILFLLELVWSFQRSDFNGQDGQLIVVPLVLVMAAGMAELERSSRRSLRIAAFSGSLILSLILFNNIAIAEVFGSPSRPAKLVRALEQDRAELRRYFSGLPAAERGFTAPQDPALQWQLRVPATTVGIGPSWSLNPQGLRASWATRTIGLPVGQTQICEQLLQSANHHLVWTRTDPDGPNTEAFLQQCLKQDMARWQEISGKLGLRTGEFKLFRREGGITPFAAPLP
ncbi:hypothetical protein [Synechococcus sp. RedBA-s]|uniref:hypothetical protein n=1 Tax=Synechococcus sp. RedBA-s TaxID=2823741 RepID=UPI0020CC5EC8|nr:hypothetical protein [Synechococcus sp. RedBA-s]MCP9801176.1 hypothetical protein [Synechococcus sp. RedBA-s]